MAGMGCDRLGELVCLSLTYVQGAFPISLSALDSLTCLSVTGGEFSARASSGLSRLTNLRILEVMKDESEASYSADPSSSSGTSLPYSTYLQDTYWLSSLANLRRLSLKRMQMEGFLPEELSSLTKLKSIDLSENQLSQVPVWIGSLAPSLRYLRITNAGLYERFPSQLFKLSSLASLDLNHNHLHGSLTPALFSRLVSLRTLILSYNELSGSIPSLLSHISGLAKLDLSYNGFSGPLPSQLFLLPSLDDLNLAHNNLISPIPPTINNAVSISALSLQANNFSGILPQSVANMTSLETLDLSENRFSGRLPVGMSGLTRLTYISLSGNLFHGAVLRPLYTLNQLRQIDLSRNRFDGVINESSMSFFSTWKDFVYWNMSHNLLSGDILKGLFHLPCHRYCIIDFSHNALTGNIPQNLGNWSVLDLRLDHNRLRGPLPTGISGLTSLTWLSLSHNQLSGTIPSGFFQDLPQLNFVDLSHNQLSGPLPSQASSSSAGGSRSSMDNGSSVLSNASTSSSGESSSSSSSSGSSSSTSNLRWVNLCANSLSSSLPSDFLKMESLEFLDLSENHLTGVLPQSSEVVASRLKYLLLSGNRFTGTIPVSICASAPNLELLTLSHNLLYGPLPQCLYSDLPSLRWLDLSGNALFGTLQNFLWVDGALNLANNYFFGGGGVTAKGNTLCDLQVHDIAPFALMPGAVKASLPQIATSVAGNCLTTGSISNASVVRSSADNDGMVILSGMSSSSSNSSSRSNSSSSSRAGGACTSEAVQRSNTECGQFCGTSGSGQCGGFGVCEIRGTVGIGQVGGGNGQVAGANRSTVQQAGEASAENTVDESAETADSPTFLGQFTCMCDEYYETQTLPNGTVTCALVIPDPVTTPGSGSESASLSAGAIAGICVGVAVAVGLIAVLVFSLLHLKKAKQRGGLDIDVCQQFSLAEVEKATDGWSRVNLLGGGGFGDVYKGVSPKGEVWGVKRAKLMSNDFEVEVYAMASLNHPRLVRLHGFCQDYNESNAHQEQILIYEFVPNGDLRKALHGRASGVAPLSLSQRLDIAAGVAEGLAYLHSFDPPIVHRDIKPANILLDGGMLPKVADFGFLKKLQEGEGITRLAGTPGYTDPDYVWTHTVSVRSDVYSLGIVILELVTGQEASDPLDVRDHILEWVQPMFEREEVDKFKDPTLIAPNEAILEITLLAMDCTRCPAMFRPTMKDVMLRSLAIKAKYGGLIEEVNGVPVRRGS